jgi:hypothetical protein
LPDVGPALPDEKALAFAVEARGAKLESEPLAGLELLDQHTRRQHQAVHDGQDAIRAVGLISDPQ